MSHTCAALNCHYSSYTTTVPGASPQSVSVRPDSSFTIRVAWSQPPVDQQKGPIIRYSVVYGVRPALEQAQSTRAVAVGSPYFVRHLAPYTEYYIKVAAATVNGTGPYSSIYTAKTYAYSELSVHSYTHSTMYALNNVAGANVWLSGGIVFCVRICILEVE